MEITDCKKLSEVIKEKNPKAKIYFRGNSYPYIESSVSVDQLKLPTNFIYDKAMGKICNDQISLFISMLDESYNEITKNIININTQNSITDVEYYPSIIFCIQGLFEESYSNRNFCTVILINSIYYEVTEKIKKLNPNANIEFAIDDIGAFITTSVDVRNMVLPKCFLYDNSEMTIRYKNVTIDILCLPEYLSN